MDQNERILGYHFFSGLFLGTFPPELMSAWGAVAELLALSEEETSSISNTDVTELQRAWARTFFGVGEETVTLTESSWGNPLRLQCQAPCLSAQATYREAGVLPEETADRLFDDHVSMMLGFMGWALSNDYDPQKTKRFFHEHFGYWIDALVAASLARLDNEAAKTLFRAFLSFIESERALFSEAS